MATIDLHRWTTGVHADEAMRELKTDHRAHQDNAAMWAVMILKTLADIPDEQTDARNASAVAMARRMLDAQYPKRPNTEPCIVIHVTGKSASVVHKDKGARLIVRTTGPAVSGEKWFAGDELDEPIHLT